jgi:thiamine biosynthesis protein ThiI
MIHVTLSGDIFLKSRRTQPRMIKRVLTNLERALAGAGYTGGFDRLGSHRFALDPGSNADGVVDSASRVFGVASIDTVEEVSAANLDSLAGAVAAAAEERVVGKTFGVRIKRRGTHDWRSYDLASLAGQLLVDAGGSVDLDDPDEWVEVTVLDDRAFLVSDHRRGPAGLPIGTQEPVLSLISGGFDSIVAAWMLMSRGCTIDYVHFQLDCAQADHALAVARTMWERWGYGSDPRVHLVEFEPIKEALISEVEPRMRQVALKVLMARAASTVAGQEGIQALVTGDALGQVSSQTLPHLVAVSNQSTVPILRPLLGMPKEAIIDRARAIGTAEISARAREVCDLSEGRPVATGAREASVARSVADVPDELMSHAVETRKTFQLRDWMPGSV